MEQPCIFLYDAPVTLAADADTSWIQIAKVGTFKDPRYGVFSITLSDFAKWIKNFSEFSLAEGHLGLPVDVDHSPEKKGDTEAVGWVKELEKRADELWGQVQWNSLGKELIADKRYAYISPSYSDNYQDEQGRKHGAALLGVALTNRPFLQMATVNLSQFDFASSQKPKTAKTSDDADDVGLSNEDLTDLDSYMCDVSEPDRMAHAVVVKKVDGATKHMFPIPPGDRLHARLAKAFLPRAIAAGHITEQEAEAVRTRAESVLGSRKGTKQHGSYSHRQMETNAILTALSLDRKTLGVADDADDATVLTALAKHQADKSTAIPEGHVVLSTEQVTKLTADATAGAAAAESLRVSTFDTAFTAAQTAGKVTLAQKDSFKELYDLNGEKTIKLLDGLQPVISMSPNGSGVEPSDLSHAEAQLAGQYADTVTPRTVDPEGLKILATAEAIQLSKNVPFERALDMAYAGVTV